MRGIPLFAAIGSLALMAACGGSAEDDAAAKASSDTTKPGASSASGSAAAPRPASRTLAAGTRLTLEGITDVTSQKHQAGMAYSARTTAAVRNSAGTVVIPAGSVLSGTVTTLVAAGSPRDSGAMAITLTSVRIGTQDHPIATQTVSMATHQVSRGITVDDAAKVAGGAAVGGVAGRVIGGNRTGAAVGAVAGGAAGAVVANRTKDHDIALSPGAAVVVTLSSPFTP